MWRRKSRGEASLDLPMYAALVRQPTRGLPIELQQEEAGASYLTNRDAIQHELLDVARRPRDDVPLFVELMTRDHGVVAIPLDGSEQSLPVFSTPWRARDYVRTLLAKKRDVTYLSSSPLQLVSMLRDLEPIGVTSLTLDRCPRCSTLAIFRTHDMVSPNDVLVVWSVHKAAEMSRADLYVGFALVSARAGARL